MQFRFLLKRFRHRYRYRNSVLVSVPDTDTKFRSDTTWNYRFWPPCLEAGGQSYFRGRTCLEAGHVQNTSGPDLSWGRTCPKHFGAGLVSRPDMSKTLRGRTCLKAWHVQNTSRPDMSKTLRGWTCLEAGHVQKLWGWTCPKHFEAGLVSRLDLSWTYLRAGLVQPPWGQTCPINWRPDLSQGRTCPRTSRPDLSQHFEAGLVQNTLGLDLSKTLQGWTCLEAGLVPGYYRAGLVQKLWGWKWPKPLRPELSRGRSWFRAGLVLELLIWLNWRIMKTFLRKAAVKGDSHLRMMIFWIRGNFDSCFFTYLEGDSQNLRLCYRACWARIWIKSKDSEKKTFLEILKIYFTPDQKICTIQNQFGSIEGQGISL